MTALFHKITRRIIHLLILLFPITLAGESSVQIKWDFKEQSLREVLREIADVYEIGFVFSDDIVDNVRITCHIEDMTFRDAISLILKEANLEYQILPHQVMVITPKNTPDFHLPQEVVILHTKESSGTDSLKTFQAIFPEQILRETKTAAPLRIPGLGQFVREQISGKRRSAAWIRQSDIKPWLICEGDHNITSIGIPFDLLPLLRQVSGSTGVMDDIETNPANANRAMTLDGIPLYHQIHLSGILSSVNREAVSSVGYHPISWDTGLNFGITGLIEMETPSLRPDSSTLSLRLHSLGMDASAAFSPRKDIQTLIAYRGSYPERFLDNMDSGFERLMWIARKNVDISDPESSDFSYHDITAKCQITAMKNMPISVTVLDTRDQSDAADQTRMYGNFHETFKNTGLALGTEYFWNLCHQTNLDLAYSFYENAASYANPFYSDNTYCETDRISHFIVNLKDRWLISPEWHLNVHVGLNRQELGHDFLENGFLHESNKINTQVHSAIHTIWLTGSDSEWKARINLKYSALQEEIYVEPAASWSHPWSPDTRIGVEYARTVQDVIRLSHTFYTPIPKLTKDFWLILDSPARANNLVFWGVSKCFGWDFIGRIFLSRIAQIPYLLPEPEIENISIKQNFYEDGKTIGTMRQAGFSCSAAKTRGKFNIALMYHLLYEDNQSDRLNGGKSFPSANRLHRTNFSVLYNSAAWQLSASYTLASGKNYTDTEPEYLITPLGIDYWPHVNESENLNAFHPPWYNRLDLGASYCFRIGGSAHLKLGFSLLNALNDQNIVAPYHYDLNSGIPQVIQNTRGLGRAGLLFLEVGLKKKYDQ